VNSSFCRIGIFALVVFIWATVITGCTSQNQEVPLYDDFNDNSIHSDLWQQRITGQQSKLEINDGLVEATAVNDPDGETGRAGLNFVNPNFEAFQADVRILAYHGDEKTRVRLEGFAYDTNLRTGQSRQGEVVFYFYVRTMGKVGYSIERCDDADCEARTLIAQDTIATVDPADLHTLTMGFDESKAYFRLDDGKTVTVDLVDEYPVGTAGWGYAGVRARSKAASESVTVEIDNIRVGTVKELFGR
jgi:hypothetical protein